MERLEQDRVIDAVGKATNANVSGGQLEDERPLGSYAAIMAVFGAVFGGLLVVTRDRLPERIGAGDLVLGAVATHKISRLIAKDKVTQPLRAPFTENPEESAPSEVSEEAAGGGPQRAIGELLACPYCIGMWVASALLYGLALAPRLTRFVCSVFTAHAGSDFLQLAYSKGQGSS
jgi:hypothetical protein